MGEATTRANVLAYVTHAITALSIQPREEGGEAPPERLLLFIRDSSNKTQKEEDAFEFHSRGQLTVVGRVQSICERKVASEDPGRNERRGMGEVVLSRWSTFHATSRRRKRSDVGYSV